MKRFSLYIAFALSSFASATLTAQEIEVEPQVIDSMTITSEYTVSKPKPEIEDATILAMIDGLMSTPLYEGSDRITNLTSMFVQWVLETDKVTVEILPYFVDLTKTNKFLSIPFLCGWTKYALENGWKKSDFPLEENVAAVQSVLSYYKSNEEKMLKDAYILDLEEKSKNNELESYLRTQIEDGKKMTAVSEAVSSIGEVEDPSTQVLFLVEGKEVSIDKLQEIDPSTIHEVTVLKDEKEVKKYTKKKGYQGVVLVKLKK